VVLLSRNIRNISNKFFLLLIAFMCMSCKKLFSFSLLTPPFSTLNNKIQSSLTFFLSSSLPIFSMLAYFINTKLSLILILVCISDRLLFPKLFVLFPKLFVLFLHTFFSLYLLTYQYKNIKKRIIYKLIYLSTHL
jgi:hypothetical protein